MNIKVFNLMSKTNETRHVKWHETCKCKCRLDASVCNNKQRWNEDKCMCKCRELIDKGAWDKGFVWNPRNCECECDKSCNIGECLHYSNCKCRKKFVDMIVEEYIKSIDEVKITEVTQAENKCSSCALYIALLLIFFTTSIITCIYFVYFYWYLKKIFQVLCLISLLKK